MDFQFSLISGKVIAGIVKRDPNIVYDTVRATYINYELGNVVNPSSFFLRFPDKVNSRIIALPAAFTKNEKIAGIKWIGSNPDNIKHGLSRASATIILNDYETCYPLACLEGSIISALRTSYSAVLAAEEIKKGQKKIKKLGIVGNGLIARYIFNAFLEQKWKIEEILLFDSNLKYSDDFAQYVNKLKNKDLCVSVANSLKELLISADLIVLATTAAIPYISDLNLFSHNPILLNISLRDLSPEILLSSNNVVDDIEHVLQANTSPHLAFQICGNNAFINGTIGGLINKKVKLVEKKPTIFSPMGMGILDIAVAYCVYKKALIEKLVTNVSDFFYDKFSNDID